MQYWIQKYNILSMGHQKAGRIIHKVETGNIVEHNFVI